MVYEANLYLLEFSFLSSVFSPPKPVPIKYLVRIEFLETIISGKTCSATSSQHINNYYNFSHSRPSRTFYNFFFFTSYATAHMGHQLDGKLWEGVLE